jgi:hypothetical protein
MPTPLTNATVLRIARMFPLVDQDLVSTLLIEECGDNLPLLKPADSAAIERIRFAVLKLSGGDLNALQRAIDLVQVDWRDTLMAAGFGSDATVHESWSPGTPTR